MFIDVYNSVLSNSQLPEAAQSCFYCQPLSGIKHMAVTMFYPGGNIKHERFHKPTDKLIMKEVK